MSYLDELFSLDQKVAIVTGAARGNGKAISEALLRAGSTVILVDILKDELQDTVCYFKSQQLKALMYECDLKHKTKIIELVEFTINKLKKIDILVNNAGVSCPHDLLDYPDEFWEKTYEINLKAPFELSREVARYMKRENSGVIINITSLNSELAFPDNPAYVAFKGALRQLGKSLALDLGKYNIRVNNIGPGYFRTSMTRKSWEDHIIIISLD